MAATFSVYVDGETHEISKNPDAVFVGAQCEDCGSSEFSIEKWSGEWSVVCFDCGRRFIEKQYSARRNYR